MHISFASTLRTAALAVSVAALPAFAQNVNVTPLGGAAGELCPQDRALVFEDPNGTRILYDPGRTVAGVAEPVDLVVLAP